MLPVQIRLMIGMSRFHKSPATVRPNPIYISHTAVLAGSVLPCLMICPAKALAMRLNVPIVITHTCQSTTPDLASSETSYPTLNPKKYSPIYDFADVLLVLHRPDAFGVRQDACGNDLHNTLVVGIEKNCHASQGVLRMKYDFSKKSVWEEE